jgi:hypothetical protein
MGHPKKSKSPTSGKGREKSGAPSIEGCPDLGIASRFSAGGGGICLRYFFSEISNREIRQFARWVRRCARLGSRYDHIEQRSKFPPSRRGREKGGAPAWFGSRGRDSSARARARSCSLRMTDLHAKSAGDTHDAAELRTKGPSTRRRTGCCQPCDLVGITRHGGGRDGDEQQVPRHVLAFGYGRLGMTMDGFDA